MKPKSKQESERPTTFAKGGAANRMLGKGDRTRTASSDAANTQAQGVTGHKTSLGQNLKQAAGGSRTSGAASLSKPAAPGRTGHEGSR
jgi:hypothetical protein